MFQLEQFIKKNTAVEYYLKQINILNIELFEYV